MSYVLPQAAELKSLAPALPPLRLSRLRWLSELPHIPVIQPLGEPYLLLGGFAIALVLLLGSFGLQALLRGNTELSPTRRAPAAGAPTPDAPALVPASLRLEARHGESWVLLEDLQGSKRFSALLRPGNAKQLAIGSGLRIRSGRSDRLYLSIGSQPFSPLGGINDFDWVVVRP